jgi:hypothetical protein
MLSWQAGRSEALPLPIAVHCTTTSNLVHLLSNSNEGLRGITRITRYRGWVSAAKASNRELAGFRARLSLPSPANAGLAP